MSQLFLATCSLKASVLVEVRASLPVGLAQLMNPLGPTAQQKSGACANTPLLPQHVSHTHTHTLAATNTTEHVPSSQPSRLLPPHLLNIYKLLTALKVRRSDQTCVLDNQTAHERAHAALKYTGSKQKVQRKIKVRFIVKQQTLHIHQTGRLKRKGGRSQQELWPHPQQLWYS